MPRDDDDDAIAEIEEDLNEVRTAQGGLDDLCDERGGTGSLKTIFDSRCR